MLHHHTPLARPPRSSRFIFCNGYYYDPSPTRVARGLYMGAMMAGPTRDEARSGRFHVIVHCAREVVPVGPLHRGSVMLFSPFADTKTPLDAETLSRVKEAARKVHLARRQGKRVLVACAMGLNRSGLVTGLALRLAGASPEHAVSMIREARGPDALSNEAFEGLIHGLEL